MSAGYLIQSILEFALIIALILGLVFEDRLARWEAKLWRKIKDRVTNAVRYGK